MVALRSSFAHAPASLLQPPVTKIPTTSHTNHLAHVPPQPHHLYYKNMLEPHSHFPIPVLHINTLLGACATQTERTIGVELSFSEYTSVRKISQPTRLREALIEAWTGNVGSTTNCFEKDLKLKFEQQGVYSFSQSLSHFDKANY